MTPLADMIEGSALDLSIEDDPAMRAAVTLVAAAHRTRDTVAWTGLKLWDQLAARVLLATYRAGTLPEWWEQMCRSMGCGQPSNKADRAGLAAALAVEPAPVLHLLARSTETVCLRVRLAIELDRTGNDQTNTPSSTDAQEAML